MTTLPNNNPITNIASMGFQYLVDPTTIPVSAAILTNDVGTVINVAYINLLKYSSPAYVKVNDEITYTLVLNNIGNTSANDVVLIDTIPNGTALVNNSVYLNNILIPNGNPAPPLGINLGTIPSNGTSTLQFKVIVNTVPSPNPVINNSTASFKYTVDPSIPNGKSTGNVSNFTSTKFNQAIIDNSFGGGLVKKASKKYAKINDIVNYTISLRNTGNADASNIILIDTIPEGTSFVSNSLTLNGITVNGASPVNPGFTLASIPAGGLSTVSFNVKVDTIPSANPVRNAASINFTYTVDPSVPNGTSGFGNSNIESTQINQAIIDNNYGNGFIKYSDPPYVKIGDTITYTITLKNTGNVQASNLLLTDTLPIGTTFVNNSVLVNNVSVSGATPSGITIASIASGSLTTVQFKAKVTAIPSINPLPNSSTLAFKFTVDPSVPNDTNGSGNSNTVFNQVNTAIIDNVVGGGLTESVNTPYAKIGDILTYTVALKNTGNVSANNIVFTDTVPIGSSLVSNSITLNGIIQSDTIPIIKVNIGSIASNSSSTIQFKVLVNYIPSVNPMPNSSSVNFTFTADPSIPNGINSGGNSNVASVQINQAIIDNANGNGLIKYVSSTNATVDDVLTYRIALKNTGNTIANNVVLFDTIPTGTSLIPNSVIVNNVSMPNANPSSLTGINVGNIAANAITTVSFNVKILNTQNLSLISNSSRVRFNYTVNPELTNAVTGFGNSNTVSTNVNIAIIDGTNGSIFNEINNPYFVSTKNFINYTLRLKNSGTVSATNVTLLCTIPDGTSFVPNSFALNDSLMPGANPDYPLGVNLGSIPSGSLSTVTFRLIVDTIPSPNLIEHSSTIKYDYLVDPSIPRIISNGANSNSSSNRVNEAIINNTAGGLVKSVSRSSARVGATITYTIRAFNIGNVSASNLILRDTIPEGTTFVPDSVSINGSVVPSLNPASANGINLGMLPPATGVTLSFKVTVTSVPNTNPIPNTASVMFRYLLDPSTFNTVMGTGTSNEVTTQINQASIDSSNGGFKNTLSNLYLKLADTVTNTFVLKNTGNIPANNVVLTSTIPDGASLTINSVTLNGNQVANANIYAPAGISIGTLNPNESATVTLDMTIVSLPASGEIATSGTVKFNHFVDPDSTIPEVGFGNSNIAKAKVSDAVIDSTKGIFTKAVAPAYIKLGETVTYTFGLKNTGNVTANNVFLKDTIPNGLTFVNGSITINGVPINATSIPSSGISIGSISAGTTSTVQFKTILSTIPDVNPLNNTSFVDFSYTVNPSIPNGVRGYGSSNSTYTAFRQAIIDKAFTDSFVTNASTNYSKIGDEITYTVSLKNVGNISANDLILRNTIPNGTSFIPNSVLVNDNPVTGSVSSNILSINIGNLSSTGTVVIKYKLLVTAIPIGNFILNTPTVVFSYAKDPSTTNVQGTGTSNSTSVRVNQALINSSGFVKSVSPAFADVGGMLTYNLILENKGNTAATNVVVFDTLPMDLSFISNSLSLNGTSVTTGDLSYPNGLNIGTIPAGNISMIAFNVSITTIPEINPTQNSATVKFKFTVDPSLPNDADGSGNSNITSAKINRAIIDNTRGLTQSISKDYSTIDDILDYTVVLQNTGSTDALNVVLTETFPSGIAFVLGSATVNGASLSTANPTTTGINIGTLAVNAVSTATFKVKVNSIPNNDKIETTAKVKFNYKINPSLQTLSSGSGASNLTVCNINAAIINNLGGIFVESVTPTYSTIGDIITYSFNLANTGNVTAYNLHLLDTLPSELEFVPNSVKINGATFPGISPDSPNGIALLTDLNVGDSLIVEFKAKVLALPNANPLTDNASIKFDYTFDPNLPMIEGTGTSSNSSLFIMQAIIDGKGFAKSVDYAYSTIGDIITYTLSLTNTGNTKATNIYLVDTIPEGLSFIENSVFVDGFIQFDANPQPGFGLNISAIPAGQTSVITFSALVNNLPTVNPAQNSATLEFTYTVDPSIPNGNAGYGNSNTIDTLIVLATIDKFDVIANPNYIKLGDTITYTVVLPNTGNTTANNIILTSTLPNGTTFVPNSVYVDGLNRPNTSPLSEGGISIQSVKDGSSSTVTFKLLVVSIPSPNPIPLSTTVNFDFILDPSIPTIKTASGNSIISYAQLNSAIIDKAVKGSFEKASKTKYSKVNNTINYSLTLKNVGNQSANNVIIVDTLPDSMRFVNGSLIVDGRNYPTASVLPPAGLPIGTIIPNQTVTVTFNALVLSIPSPNPIPNSAAVKFVYTVDPESPVPTIGAGVSSTSSVSVREAIIDKNKGFTKSVNKSVLAVKDIVTYTIALNNIGNTPANNITLIDTIPDGLIVIPDSFSINGVKSQTNNSTLSKGIDVGGVPNGSITTIVFKATVNSIPNPNTAVNEAYINYSYTLDPSIPNGESRSGVSNKVTSTINSVDLSYLSGGFVLSADKTSLKINDDLTYTAVLTNLGNIPAYNVLFTNAIPEGTTFIENSVIINNDISYNSNPSESINLGTISPNAIVTVSFKVEGSSIPANNALIVNNASIDYEYYLDPSLASSSKGTEVSNTIETSIAAADISNPNGGFELTSDKSIVLVGDTVTYTINLENKGNVVAEDVTLYSTIPSFATLIAGSVLVNNIASTDNPESGIYIGQISPGEKAQISFSLNVKYLPPDGILDSDGTVTFNYQEVLTPTSLSTNDIEKPKVNPLGTTQVINLSNLLRIRVVSLIFDSSHTVDKRYEDLNETLNYKIIITNNGNIDLQNFVIQDTIPNGTEFVTNSFAINGVVIPGINPSFPYNIGNINVDESVVLTLSVNTVSIPAEKILYNYIVTNFEYSVDPIPINPNSLTTNNISTNSFIQKGSKIYVSDPSELKTAYIGDKGFVLSTDKDYVTDSDVITYTLLVENIGTVDAQNIIITTTLPNGISIVSGSVTINDNGYPGVDPASGISLGSMAPSKPSIIRFKAKVLPDLSVSEVATQFNIHYGYEVQPSSPLKFVSNSSNICNFVYKKSNLIINLTSDKTKANLDNPIAYTMTIKNIGNTDADTALIKTLLDSALSFMPGTIMINNVPYPSLDISQGIDLSRIPANSEVVITFSALVKSPAAGYLISTSTNSDYTFTVDPKDPSAKANSESNKNNILALIYLNRNKQIPCNPLCQNSSPCKIFCTNVPMCCCNTLRSKVYSVEDLSTALECISAGIDIKKYKMWTQSSVNTTMILNDPKIVKIQSVSAKLDLIKTSSVDTPVSINGNLEGKLLSGKLQVVETLITFTVCYLNNRGQTLSKKCCKIFSNSIVTNKEYFNTLLKAKGIIEDISITDFSNGIISLSATSLVYMVKSSESDQNTLSKLTCINGSMDNFNICKDKDKFLSESDLLWNSTSVYSTDVACSKEYLAIYSSNAKVEVLSTKKLNKVTNSSGPNSENLKSTSKELLVNMLLTVSVNFAANIGTQYINIPCEVYIPIPDDHLPSDNYSIDTCIENLYVGTIGTTVYTSSNIVVKAKQIREF